ncbi:MAG TPA: hypothetical protein VKG78_08765 [Opitutaceae bacterium]|nr:hypothetical protein [Opitutaceae bacterium]
MRGAREWLGDLGRLSWGLIYWNLRKSAFRIRGASGRAPCQHPSDSGRAGETACEACAGWRSAARFRRLCPLLGVSAGGRRVCSVDAKQVRPFWGRALLLFGGSAAVLALVAALGAFSAFRAIGYRVPLYVVAWPPAWHRVQQARADYFYLMAVKAFNSGDMRRGLLALNQVYELDPGNVSAALLLAQFTQVANPDYSDSIYGRLLLQRRGDAEETARAWFRALLSRGDFASLSRLSGRMLREGAAHAPAWTQGILFAERMTGDPSEVDRLLSAPGQIQGAARSVLSLARDIRSGTARERLRRVELSVEGAANPFELYYSLGRLTELGRASDVVAFLDGAGGASLEPYDRESLKLDACSILDWRALERKEIGFILEQGSSAPVVTLVAAHLIRHPSADAAAFVFGQLDLKPLPATADKAGAHVALLCMAGVNGLDARMKQEAGLLGRMSGGQSAAWGRIVEFFESSAASKNPAAFLPALHQLPLEVVYALTASYRTPASGNAGAHAGAPGSESDRGSQASAEAAPRGGEN